MLSPGASPTPSEPGLDDQHRQHDQHAGARRQLVIAVVGSRERGRGEHAGRADPQELDRDGSGDQTEDDAHRARARAGAARFRAGPALVAADVVSTFVASQTTELTRMTSITPGIAIPESLNA